MRWHDAGTGVIKIGAVSGLTITTEMASGEKAVIQITYIADGSLNVTVVGDTTSVDHDSRGNNRLRIWPVKGNGLPPLDLKP